MAALDFHKKLEKNVEITSAYKQLCRFCLEGASSKKIDNKSLELFKLLTNVELVCSSEYPKSICSLCESQLESACKLRVSLLEMERCWSEFFRRDYLQFITSIDISEEHIYDEIFLEIEMDARDEDTSSSQFIDRSSTPLINAKNQLISTKSSCVKTRSVQVIQYESIESYVSKDINNLAVTMTEKNKSDQRQTLYLQKSENTRIMQNMQKPSLIEGSQSFEFEDYSQPMGSMSEEDQISGRHLMERTHDTVSLSYESVNKCLPKENKLHKRKSQVAVSKANKVIIKCVLVGDGAVGKTNLIISYLKNKFVDQHIPTASDIYKFDVKVNKRPVQVMLYDTAGQDSLDHLRQLSYPDCHVFLICFSVVHPESFSRIKSKWVPTFRSTNASLVLVGTQSDLRSNLQTISNLKRKGLRPVPLSDAWDLAKSIGAEYIETSSRNNAGVKNAFDTAIEYALSATETTDSKKSSFWKKLICLG